MKRLIIEICKFIIPFNLRISYRLAKGSNDKIKQNIIIETLKKWHSLEFVK